MGTVDHYGLGRNIDPAVGLLTGEAAGQEVRSPREHPQRAPLTIWQQSPVRHFADQREPDYYGRPAVKEPVWIWSVPLYFYVGGVAGAAAVLAAALQVREREDLRGLRRRCRTIGAAGAALGSGLLTYDLGRPGRFLHMLRVFRPSSPMSVGSWTLAKSGGALALSLLAETKGSLAPLGRAAGAAGGMLGIPLAGYTGVLLANTAVPLWQAARRPLPVLFTASGMAGLGDLLEMFSLSEKEQAVARRFGTLGKAAELAGIQAVEKAACQVPEVAEPLHRGKTGRMWQGAKGLTAASLLLSLLPLRRRWKKPLASVLGTAGALLLRFALFQAGKVSSQEPQATFRQQRAGHGAAELLKPGAGGGKRLVRLEI